MPLVRIVADDLTGALDTGAPFAGAQAPLPIVWDRAPAQGSFALDTESRDRDTGLLAAVLPALAEADIAYKKIDSLLRGRTVEEIALCLQSGRFRSVAMAPAFPDQQRITKDAVQYWRKAAGDPWQAVPVDLPGRLSAFRPHLVQGADGLAGDGLFLCDAEGQDELDAIAAAGPRLAKPLLWIGAAGLARALAGPGRSRPNPDLERPLLVVVGSHHPVSLSQVQALQDERADQVISVGRAQLDDLSAPIERLRAVLRADGAAALVVTLPDGTGAAVAGPIFTGIFERMADRLSPPRTLFVTGGATLMSLVRTLGADALEVQGELMPGIARARITGGRWPGATVVSKSGAFGVPDLLARLTAP